MGQTRANDTTVNELLKALEAHMTSNNGRLPSRAVNEHIGLTPQSKNILEESFCKHKQTISCALMKVIPSLQHTVPCCYSMNAIGESSVDELEHSVLNLMYTTCENKH
jgi:hypothetical protein